MKIKTEIYVGIIGSLSAILICLASFFYGMKIFKQFHTSLYTEERIAEAEQKLLTIPDESKQQKYDKIVQYWTRTMRDDSLLFRHFSRVLLLFLAFSLLMSIATLQISLKFRKYYKRTEGKDSLSNGCT